MLLAVDLFGKEGGSWERAASRLGTAVEVVTADDVTRLARNARFSTVSAEGGERWRGAGWRLVPVLAVLTLFWFRPGWLVRSGS